MHKEIAMFIDKVKREYPKFFDNVKVCEMGSMNINGSVRPFFKNCEYVGIDWRAGPEVDVVCLAHEFESNEKFDVVISTEMLEHDKYAEMSVLNMVDLLRPGGLLIITCAGQERKEHNQDCGIDNYYKNMNSVFFGMILRLNNFKLVMFENTGKDIYVYGVKNG